MIKVKRTHILDRPLNKTKSSQVSLTAFSLLFSEIIQYSQKKVSAIKDLESRLADLGARVGVITLELLTFRERNQKRDIKILGILYFIHTNVWKSLFGNAASSLEKSTDNEDEYMISDNAPIVARFISVPKEMSSFNSCAFLAGICEGILCSAGYSC